MGGEYFDFRGRLLIACCVPLVILAIGAIIYFSRLSHLKKKSKPGSQALKDMTMHSIEYIWDMFDLDVSGELNEEEFHHLLVQLNHDSPDYCHPSNTEMRLEIMRTLGAVKRTHAHITTGSTENDLQDHEKQTLVVLRPEFIEFVGKEKLKSFLRDDWIVWAERQRIREHGLSDMLLILFLLHAPLSQRGFYFFDCRNVGDQFYLQADYTIKCYTTKHQAYVPLAILFLIFFSFMFPIFVLFKLCVNRKHLHTPVIRHQLGHLYVSFTVGAEYWEIHEVFRKMILTGLLVFIPGNSRAAVAILVSVMSVATLNYFKPHKNYVVFYVAQGSFLITTFKYLSVILLSANPRDYTEHDSEVVGMLLFALDAIFMSVSVTTLFAVILILRQRMNQKDPVEELVITGAVDMTKIVPSKGRKGRGKGQIVKYKSKPGERLTGRNKMKSTSNFISILARKNKKMGKKSTKTKQSRRYSNFDHTTARNIGGGWWEELDDDINLNKESKHPNASSKKESSSNKSKVPPPPPPLHGKKKSKEAEKRQQRDTTNVTESTGATGAKATKILAKQRLAELTRNVPTHVDRMIGDGWWEKFDSNSGNLYYVSTTGKPTVWDWPKEVPTEDVVANNLVQEMVVDNTSNLVKQQGVGKKRPPQRKKSYTKRMSINQQARMNAKLQLGDRHVEL